MITLSTSWLVAAVTALAALIGIGWWALRRPQTDHLEALPREWKLAPRRVFSSDERRIHRLLRDALPNHVVLPKLPLLRLCRPLEADALRYWHRLLGPASVSFAICTVNGRVLAAIDIHNVGHPPPARMLQIKQSVLTACRIRYLRWAAHQVPPADELRQLVPGHMSPVGSPKAPEPVGGLRQARDTLSTTVATRRAESRARWHDSALFQDSFFAPDSAADASTDDDAGVVTDDPPPPPPR